MDDSKYHHGAHSVYLTQYHIVWCPEFRYPVLSKERQNRLRGILRDVCEAYHYHIRALEVMPDHVHLFVDVPQTIAPCDAVRTLKSLSAVRMLKDDPDLRRFYARCGVLWSRGHFISSVGHVSEETVMKYIEEQKTHAT
jgi:putative transposase